MYQVETGSVLAVGTGSPTGGLSLQRNWSGIISNVGALRMGDQGRGSTSFHGNLTLPHAPDGGLYISPVYFLEGTSAVYTQRGILRGLYQPLHPVTSWNDGDVIPGSGVFAGHTFLVIRPLTMSNGGSQGAVLVDTTDWVT